MTDARADPSGSTRRKHYAFAVCIALLMGVIVPFAGFAAALSLHLGETDELPRWITFAMPISSIGPESPSNAVYWTLMLANVAVWATIGYVATRFAQRVGAKSRPNST